MFYKHHCMVCNRDFNTEFPLTEQEYSIRRDKWSRGALVTEAFPELTPIQREAMITGTCGPCWKRIFKQES